MMREVWKVVADAPTYKVSNLGRIKNRKGSVLVNCDNGNGYKYVDMSGKNYTIHRTVLINFKGQPRLGMYAMHINDDKSDNRLCNLKWGTPSENNKAAYKTGRKTAPVGHRSKRAALSLEQVLELRRLREEKGIYIKDLAKMFSIAYSTANYIVNRRTYAYPGC